MSDDLDATIARQQAEQAAREALAGRYDGVLVKDLAARVRVTHADLASWRQAHASIESRGDELDLELRDLATRSPQATAVYHHRCVLAQPVAPLSPDGRPLTEATSDLRQLIDWWSPSGEFASAWPGVVCRPGTFYGLELSPKGSSWYDEIRVVRPPSRVQRLMKLITDPVTLSGVPPTGDSGDDDDRDPRPQVLATVSAPLRLVEVMSPSPPRVEAFFGSATGRDGLAALARARPRPPRLAEWLVWNWPADVTLPLGQLRSGVRAVPALPGDGAILDLDGATWRVNQWPGLTDPPPDWLIAELQKFGDGS